MSTVLLDTLFIAIYTNSFFWFKKFIKAVSAQKCSGKLLF